MGQLIAQKMAKGIKQNHSSAFKAKVAVAA